MRKTKRPSLSKPLCTSLFKLKNEAVNDGDGGMYQSYCQINRVSKRYLGNGETMDKVRQCHSRSMWGMGMG